MAQTFNLDTAAQMLGKHLLQNVEEAFYEQLRPQLDRIARTAAKNLAHSLKGYIHSQYNFELGRPEILLEFNDEDIKL